MLDPSLWFKVTDWQQFLVLVPIGIILGFTGFAAPSTDVRPAGVVLFLGVVTVFWTFVLISRALSGVVPWQQSVGTVLLNVMFVGAIYVGLKIREHLTR